MSFTNQTDCKNLGTHVVTNSLKPASPIWKTASYIQFHSLPHTFIVYGLANILMHGTCMYHCIEYLYSYGKVFRTIVADNGAISPFDTWLVCVFCLHIWLAATAARVICAKNTDLPCIKRQWPCFIYLFALENTST